MKRKREQVMGNIGYDSESCITTSTSEQVIELVVLQIEAKQLVCLCLNSTQQCLL